MMIALTLFSIYVFVIACWTLYLAVMNIARVRGQLHPVAKAHAYMLLGVGYLFDATLNLMVCLVFWRAPKDWLLTGTLKRALINETGWREATAAWICENLLNAFDPKGSHC